MSWSSFTRAHVVATQRSARDLQVRALENRRPQCAVHRDTHQSNGNSAPLKLSSTGCVGRQSTACESARTGPFHAESSVAPSVMAHKNYPKPDMGCLKTRRRVALLGVSTSVGARTCRNGYRAQERGRVWGACTASSRGCQGGLTLVGLRQDGLTYRGVASMTWQTDDGEHEGATPALFADGALAGSYGPAGVEVSEYADGTRAEH